MPSRATLTAYDRLFLAGHHTLTQRGLPGHHCFAWLDLEGPLDPDQLADGAARALRALPLMCGRIAYARFPRRPYWLMGDATPGAMAPANLPLRSIDLRSSAAPDADEREQLLPLWRQAQNPTAAPQILLRYFRLSGDGHRIALRWPHYLMDLEGAQLLLRAVGDADFAAALALANEPQAMIHRESREWFGTRLVRLMCGVVRMRCYSVLRAPRFIERTYPTADSPDYMMRNFNESTTSAILATARRQCAPGPALYTRHLMLGVARALDDLRGELGMHERDQILMPLPLRRPQTEPQDEPRQVVARNDLTIATCVISRRLLHDSVAADRALLQQIERHQSHAGREETWTTVAAAGRLPLPWFGWLLDRRWAFPRYSIGFAIMTADDWTNGFCGARVTNFSACGLPPIPPGMMLTFSRFRGRLTLGIAYYRHLCATEKVERLADRIEARIT